MFAQKKRSKEKGVSGELLPLEIYVGLAASPRKLRVFASAPPGSSLKFIHWMNFGRSALTRLSSTCSKPFSIYYGSEVMPVISYCPEGGTGISTLK